MLNQIRLVCEEAHQIESLSSAQRIQCITIPISGRKCARFCSPVHLRAGRAVTDSRHVCYHQRRSPQSDTSISAGDGALLVIGITCDDCVREASPHRLIDILILRHSTPLLRFDSLIVAASLSEAYAHPNLFAHRSRYEAPTSRVRLHFTFQRGAKPPQALLHRRPHCGTRRNRDIGTGTRIAAAAYASRGSRLGYRSISPGSGGASASSSSPWESHYGWCLWKPYRFLSG